MMYRKGILCSEKNHKIIATIYRMSILHLDFYMYHRIAFSKQTHEVGVITPGLLLKPSLGKLNCSESHTWTEGKSNSFSIDPSSCFLLNLMNNKRNCRTFLRSAISYNG